MSDDTQKTPKKIELTREGFDELKAELAELVEQKLPQAVDRVATAREYGDLSENSEYQNARDDKDLIDARIAEIEKILEKAEIVKATNNKRVVGIGSQVTIYVKGSKTKKRVVHIVGEYEADPTAGKISSVSPLGKALVNCKKGEEVKVEAPAGEITYVIEKIA